METVSKIKMDALPFGSSTCVAWPLLSLIDKTAIGALEVLFQSIIPLQRPSPECIM